MFVSGATFAYQHNVKNEQAPDGKEEQTDEGD